MQLNVVIVFVFVIKVTVQSATLSNPYSLKQVLILSRHGLRTPLAKNLAEFTPKTWPEWKEKPGYLTQRGAKLEGFMGKYFAEWLVENQLLSKLCPDEQDVFVYANLKQRTKASAKAFVDKAFPGCNVTVHTNNSEKMDPVFNPVIHNSTKIFRRIALEQMKLRLENLNLNKSYENIEKILDYRHSTMCNENKKCDLTTDANKIVNVQKDVKPNIVGPLKISNSVIDAFIMQYYQGLPIETVAWDSLTDEKNWESIMELSRGYHDVIFNTTLIAKDISLPLVKYMSDIFKNDSFSPKLILLMGHDANLYTILNGMKFKPYSLDNQFEITPVGGKIVFQRWFDEDNERDWVKIDFVYQTTEQLREYQELTLRYSPGFRTLEIDGCKVDKNGFCLWSDFIKVLQGLETSLI